LQPFRPSFHHTLTGEDHLRGYLYGANSQQLPLMHSLPVAFRTRQISIDCRVGFDHAFAVAKFTRALTPGLPQPGSQTGIIEKALNRSSQLRRVARAKRETSVAKHFGKRAQVRRYNREAPQHIFRYYQSKNFPAERRHDRHGGSRKFYFKLLAAEPARKANARTKARFTREFL
jgi:hypothetical protein